MKSLIFVLILLYNTVVFPLDRFLDINLTTDFTNLKERSHVDFNSQAVVPFSNRAFLLNPRISIYFDGSMDVSVATGLRHQTRVGTLGHHVFWDSTGTKDAHFHQIGHSLEFLTDMFDYRINYYHPITKDQIYKNFLVSPHRWFESEMVYKHALFHVGAGPKYDLFDKKWGAQAKVVVPFKYFSIASLIGYDKKKGCTAAISLSFRLYGTPRKSSMESPIQYQSRVQYSKELIFIPPPPESKKRESDEKTVIVAVPEETNAIVVASTNDEPATPPSFPPPPPKPKTWWDFFFRQEPITQ